MALNEHNVAFLISVAILFFKNIAFILRWNEIISKDFYGIMCLGTLVMSIYPTIALFDLLYNKLTVCKRCKDLNKVACSPEKECAKIK